MQILVCAFQRPAVYHRLLTVFPFAAEQVLLPEISKDICETIVPNLRSALIIGTLWHSLLEGRVPPVIVTSQPILFLHYNFLSVLLKIPTSSFVLSSNSQKYRHHWDPSDM
jgi:hypothetical protein